MRVVTNGRTACATATNLGVQIRRRRCSNPATMSVTARCTG
jgi:hypothetical protein